MEHALTELREHSPDLVLLDAGDGTGSTAPLSRLREAARDIPIVVISDSQDESLALDFIDAGAQEHLCRRELEPGRFMRALFHALSRRRRAQESELAEARAAYDGLSTQGARTRLTASLAGMGAIRERCPREYEELIASYSALLPCYFDHLTYRSAKPATAMEQLATRLGDLGASPRDLVDLHAHALHEASRSSSDSRGRALAIEGRLLALEMMGLLVEYYRVGTRRGWEREPET